MTDKTNKNKGELDDLGEVIARISELFDQLGWTKQQKKEYLKETFGKGGITLLNESELRQLRDKLVILAASKARSPQN